MAQYAWPGETLADLQITIAVQSPTPLVPLVLGDHAATLDAARALLGAGILALPLGPPITPPSATRIRFVITAGHTDDDLTAAADALHDAITEGTPPRWCRATRCRR